MTTLLLGYVNPGVLLLTYTGPRPLLLECSRELWVAAARSRRASEGAAEQRERRAVRTQQPTAKPAAPPPTDRAAFGSQAFSVDPSPDDRVWRESPPPPPSRPRPPEPHIDPRTVFKRRATMPTMHAALAPRPKAEPEKVADAATTDYIILPQNPGFRVSEQGVKSLVTYMRTAQILVAKPEKSVANGAVIELLPDVFSHLAFMEGNAPSGPPSILEGTLWFGNKPAPLPFGDVTRTTCFRIELVGARFDRLADAFLARLHQILHLRPEALVIAHDPARLRAQGPRLASGPIPRVDMQER